MHGIVWRQAHSRSCLGVARNDTMQCSALSFSAPRIDPKRKWIAGGGGHRTCKTRVQWRGPFLNTLSLEQGLALAPPRAFRTPRPCGEGRGKFGKAMDVRPPERARFQQKIDIDACSAMSHDSSSSGRADRPNALYPTASSPLPCLFTRVPARHPLPLARSRKGPASLE